MKEAPIPKNEDERMQSVQELNILDTPPEERFDRIARLAQKLFHAPISTITIVDREREWFKSCPGLNASEGKRAVSFCGHALLEEDIMVIPDTKEDPRFADNPMVIGEPFIRFYAGKSIIGPKGLQVGVICIKDHQPRTFSEDDESALKDLASWVEMELNSEELSNTLKSLHEKNEELRRFNKTMVNREIKMMELKTEIKQLKEKLSTLTDA